VPLFLDRGARTLLQEGATRTANIKLNRMPLEDNSNVALFAGQETASWIRCSFRFAIVSFPLNATALRSSQTT
jgi:hypothetical protein